MKIASVSLKDKGIKGVDVTWEKWETKNNISYRVEHKDKRSAPAQEDLIKVFNELRGFVLDVLGLEKTTDEIEVITMKHGKEGGFIFSVLLDTPSGNRVSFNTFEITANDYEHFGELEQVAMKIVKETKDYIEVGKTMSIDYYIKAVNKNNEEFNEDEFAGKTEEEKLAIYAELIEKAGGMALLPEEVGEEEADAPAEIFEEQDPPVKVPAKKEVVKKMEVVKETRNLLDDDDFEMTFEG